MITRHELVSPRARPRPWLSWSLALLLIAIFLGQQVAGGTPSSVDAFTLLDFGANAGFLVERGEWYRLVTANLLHGGLAHIGGNLFFLVIYGPLIEKRIGWRRTLLVILAAGLGAQALSAFWMEGGPFDNDTVMSLGFSGALFGLLGTLGVLNFRFGHLVSGGFRLSHGAWVAMLGLNLVVVPLLAPEVDAAAHVGGLLSGLFTAWLLLSGQAGLGETRKTGPFEKAALAVLGLVWIAGIGQAAATALDPGRRAAEHRMALRAARNWDRNRPALDNEFAWAVAAAANPSAAELDDALFLARRAVGSEQNGQDRPEERDTLATVHYRLRHYDAAVEIEQPLTYPPAVAGSRSQLARFLDARVKRDGVLWIGGAAGEPPQLSVRSGRLDMTIPEAMPKGGEIYALVKQGEGLKGMIRVHVAPGQGRLRMRDLAMADDEKIPEGEIVLAEIDRSHTDIDAAPTDAYFYPFEKTVAVLP